MWGGALTEETKEEEKTGDEISDGSDTDEPSSGDETEESDGGQSETGGENEEDDPQSGTDDRDAEDDSQSQTDDQDTQEDDGQSGDEEQPSEDGETDPEESSEEEDEAAEDEPEETAVEASADSLVTDSVEVQASSSFGSLFDEAFTAQVQEDEYTGYGVTDIVMNGNTASVTFNTVTDATLVVGVYEDDGVKMLASGSVEVAAGDTSAEVTVDGTMPEFFYLKGYLVDAGSLRPLCPAYCNEDHTRAMQEFLKKSKSDFTDDRIISLDSSSDNNFLVLKDDVKVIQGGKQGIAGVNIVSSADDLTMKYTIKKADETVKSLTNGDLIAYYYADNSLLVTRVQSVNTTTESDGSVTVDIQGEDISYDEVFRYIKIGTSDSGSVEEEQPYSYEGGISLMSGDSDKISNKWEHEFEDSDDEDHIAYSLTPSLETTLTLYYEDGKSNSVLNVEQVRLVMQYQLAGEVSLSASVDKTILFGEGITVGTGIPGVTVNLSIGAHFSAEGEISYEAAITGSIGVQVLKDGTVQNISEPPVLSAGASVTASVSMGLVISPSVNLLSRHILAVSIEGEVGVSLETTLWNVSLGGDEDTKHECQNCIDGDVNLYLSVKAAVSLLNKEIEEIEIISSDDAKIKVDDFYYSKDFNEFGWGKECPHIQYKITVKVNDRNFNPVEGAIVNSVMERPTGKDGKTWIWLQPGRQMIYCAKEGMETTGVYYTIEEAGEKEIFLTGEMTEPEDPKAVVQFCAEGFTSAAVTKDGSLYMWGANGNGQLGMGGTSDMSVPVKVDKLDKVKYIALAYEGKTSAAITDDGSLYMWGYNNYGQLGNGNTESQYIPRKVQQLSNVKDVCTYDGTSAAITEEGKLYMWGHNINGVLATGDTKDSSAPVEVTIEEGKKVRSVSIGSSCVGVITEDGSLYMWGSDYSGQLGNGDAGSSNTPTKVNIAGTVKDFVTHKHSSMALTEDGSLYMWGDNTFGKLGNGTTSSQPLPVKVEDISGVEQAGLLDYDGNISWAVTKSGSLYMWGCNEYGMLGDGTEDSKTIPTKVKGLNNVIMISSGQDYYYHPQIEHAAAVTDDYTLYVWGQDYLIPNYSSSGSKYAPPQKVMTGIKLTDLGKDYIGAVTLDGSLYIWGQNTYGNTGVGGSLYRFVTPTRVIFPDDTEASASLLSADEPAAAAEDGQSELGNPVINPSSENPARGTASFSGLTAGKLYNFYAMRSKDADNRLGNGNLLYIAQAAADGTGALQIEYELREEIQSNDNICYFIMGEEQTDIANVEVKIDNLTYTGEDLYPQVVVTYGGVALKAGVDYELYGSLVAKDIGTYNVTVKGIGTYKGEKSATYKVLEEGVPDEPEPDEPDPVKKIDINSDRVAVNVENLVYTGKEQSPEVTVAYGGVLLEEEIDYILSGDLKVTDIGEYTVTVQGIGDYTGEKSVTYKVVDKDDPSAPVAPEDRIDISSGRVTVHIEDLVYTGRVLSPDVSVVYGGALLRAGKDYILNGDLQVIDPGEYTVKLRGIGAYTGEREASYRVVKADADNPDGSTDGGDGVLAEDLPADGKIPDGLWIAGLAGDGYTYTGKAIKPQPETDFRVYDAGVRLTYGTDYTVSYKNNTKANDALDLAKAPSITVKGKGNYGGSAMAVFKINPVSLDDESTDITNAVLDDTGSAEGSDNTVYYMYAAYNKKVQKPVPALSCGGKKLSKGRDYTVEYPSAAADAYKAAGTYDILIKAIGNYSGQKTVRFVITDEKSTLISKASVKTIAAQDYTGMAIEPDVTVTYKKKPLTKGTHYTVSFVNNVNAGTATAIVKGTGKPTEEGTFTGFKKVTFKIKGTAISKAAVSGLTGSFTYTGGRIEPAVTLSFSGKTLTEGRDYEISYLNNVKAGKATVTVTGKGAYTGTAKKTYKIKPYDIKTDPEKRIRDNTGAALTVKYVKGGAKPDAKLVFTVSDGSGTASVKLTAGKDYTVTYKKNKAVGSEAEMTIKGKGNFTGTLTKPFTIESKSLEDAQSPVTMELSDVVYTDKPGRYMASPVLTDADGKKLAAGKDYDKAIVYALAGSAGKAEASDTAVLDKKSKPELGSVIKVTVKAKEGSGYTGTISGTYRITKTSFTKAKITVKAKSYTGKAIKLTQDDITVTLNGAALKLGDDYEIVESSYKNNRNKGTATVTIRGCGSYGGSKSVKFKITNRLMSAFQ